MDANKLVMPDQVRAARALLGWTAKELAEKCGVHVATINRLEGRSGDISSLTLGSYQKLLSAFTAEGIEFVDETLDDDFGPTIRRRGVILVSKE